ncbi:prostatic acid phosphatase [Agrilus planipennis]|uniref:acid phosphatase n=1 Tax=Agrilus planipennis TaxID=224129 RepID=A0A1W4WI36_AGRPL|nr:prostatic acid phosphatase [Agrilus planipennis]
MSRLCKIVTLSLFIVFSTTLVKCETDFNATGVSELVGVIVIFRHGDRTPVQPYPNDPYKNESLWPVGFGQLTSVGKRRQLRLGQWLRSRYDGFLPDKYSEKDIYVRSTDVDRTLMSAEANLAGLYPPSGDQVWDQGLQWQPIPVHTIPEKEDYVLSGKKPCVKYNRLLRDLLKSPDFVNINRKNHDLYAYLTRYSGSLVNSLETLESLYNTLFIETIFNFTLPNWTVPVYPKKMRPFAELSFATLSFTEDLARLKTGPLITEMVNHFKERISYLERPEENNNEIKNTSVSSNGHFEKIEQPEVKSRKFWIYSAHDITIANVLQSLKLFQYHCPPYASTILIELRSLKSEYFVNIFYKNSTVPQQMKLKDCEFNCPFDKFLKIVEPLVIDAQTWQNECNTEDYDFEPLTIVVLIGLICFIFLSLFALKVCVGSLTDKKEHTKGYPYWRLANEEV